MAWITPVTDRKSGASKMTYVDMNRISGNIAYLYDYAVAHGYTISHANVQKTSWTQNDIVTYSDWYTDIIGTLAAIKSAVGLNANTVSIYAPRNYYDVNQVEKHTLNTLAHIIEPTGGELLQTESAIQIQADDGTDIEAGVY